MPLEGKPEQPHSGQPKEAHEAWIYRNFKKFLQHCKDEGIAYTLEDLEKIYQAKKLSEGDSGEQS